MKGPKLTRWYPADVNPVHKGVYEIRVENDSGLRWFRYWDGRNWMEGSWHPGVAKYQKHIVTMWRDQWRGLTEKVK